MKKIIHVVLGKANPERMNGVNRVVHALAAAQHSLGHPVEIWGITPSPEAPAPDRPFPTRTFRAQSLPLALDKSLTEYIAKENCDSFFHLHGGFIQEMFRVGKLLSKHDLKFIFTPHGSYNPGAIDKSGFRKRVYFNLFEKQLLSRAKVVHCIGQSEAVALKKMLPNVTTALVPNGQDLEVLPNRKAWPRPEQPICFSFCGRMRRKTKGLDILLDGFKQYRNLGGNGILMMLGDGEDHSWAVNRARELGLENQVDFMGARFGEEKFELLSSSDAFIHVSRNEGMPTAVLEALGFGLPCILSYETNLGDYLKKGRAGIVLEENTPEYLAHALLKAEKLKGFGILSDMAANGIELVRREFNWSRIASNLASQN